MYSEMFSRKQIAQLTAKDYALFFSHFLAYIKVVCIWRGTRLELVGNPD